MTETHTVHILGPDQPPYIEEWPTNSIPKEKYEVLKDEQGHLYVLYAYEGGEKQTEVIKKSIWMQAKAAMGY